MGERLIEFNDEEAPPENLSNTNSNFRGRAASFKNYYKESLDDEVNPLEAVFNSCDYNGDGFVKITDLLNLAKQHASVDNNNSGEEELQFLLEQLDVKGDGKITYDEFVSKIREIVNGSNQEDDVIENDSVEQNHVDHSKVVVPEIEIGNDLVNHRPRSYTDSEGFFEEADTTSHSTASTNDYNGDIEDPSFSTPLKSTPIKNKKHDIYSTFPPNGKHPKETRTTLFEIRERQLSRTSEYQSQEDGFESNDDNEESFFSLPLSQTPSSRLAARNITTSQSARASLHGSREEMGYNAMHHKHSLSDSEADYGFLTDQIQKLSAQLSLMQMDQSNHNDQQSKIQEDNKVLVNRINALEEQLHDQKTTSVKAVEETASKYKKQLEKIHYEHENHIHNLQIKLGEAEQQIENLKTVEPMLRKEIESSLEERRLAQQRIDNLQSELLEKEKEIEQLKYKLRSKNDEFERERKSHAEEILVLTQELDHLKYMKDAAINQFDERNDLIKQIEILKRENSNLKASKDELCNQLLQKGTMMELDKKSSLADELVSADKNDVLDALRDEESENHRLKQYIDQLLILIMQNSPWLLEK